MRGQRLWLQQPRLALAARAVIFVVLSLATVMLTSRFVTERLPGSFPASRRLKNFPPIMLWAWEQPQELRFIKPQEVGVAFLARTVYLRGADVRIRPRLQPLKVPEGTALMAVTRIEADRSVPPTLSVDQRTRVVSAIAELARLPGVTALQVDFDATTSQRAFYRDVLHDLRRQLPDPVGLSITALASWCLHDHWLSGLPVDEAVPMLFRMGADHQQVIFSLQAKKDFRPAVCRNSLGIATDEPLPRLPSGRRVYIFCPSSWSAPAVQTILQEVRQWQ